MSELRKKVERVVELSEWLSKHIEEVERLEHVTSFMKKHVICDPYSEWCPWLNEPVAVKDLRGWLVFLDVLYERDVTEAFDYWGIKYHFDVEKSMIIDVCLRDSLRECVYVNIQLPITNKEEVKNKLINAVKDRIRKIVESLPENFARNMLVIAEFIETVESRLRNLEYRYEKILHEVENALGRVIEHEH